MGRRALGRLRAPDRGTPCPHSRPPGTEVRYFDPNPPQPITTLGRFAIGALGLSILADVATLIVNQNYVGLVSGRLGLVPPLLGDVDSAITDLKVAHDVSLGVFFLAAALFAAWFFRAYRNLARGGIQDLRFGTGWAIGGWFVPFFNWVRPKGIANDIWRGTEALAERRVEGWRARPVPALVHWWWGCWLVGTITGFLARPGAAADGGEFFRLTERSLRDERVALYFRQAGILFMIAAAVLAIVIIWRMSQVQDDALIGFRFEDSNAFEPVAGGVAALSAQATKTCPECAEEVKAAARKCRYCGYRFAEPA